MSTTPRSWTINGDFVTLQPTGVARYAREVTLALDKLVSEQHPLAQGLAIDLVTPRPPVDLPLRRIPVRIVPEFDKPRLPQFWVQAQLPHHVAGGLLSLLQSCANVPAAAHRLHSRSAHLDHA